MEAVVEAVKVRQYNQSDNNKGLTCPFKPVTCQEGYCLECGIYNQHKGGFDA